MPCKKTKRSSSLNSALRLGDEVFLFQDKGRMMQPKQAKRARPKAHKRKLKSGRVIKVNKGVKKKIHKGIINTRERRIFDALSSDKRLSKVEYGGTLDFEKKGKKTYLETFETTVGESDDIEFNIHPDREIFFHSHPDDDLLAFSFEDIDSILGLPSQQGEILFHDGRALTLIKPKGLNRNKFLREYKRKVNQVVFGSLSKKGKEREMQRFLRSNGFKIKEFKKGKEIDIPIKVI